MADDPEQDFLLTLKVKVPGHGRKEHRRKLASDVKRALETSLQTRVEVEMYNPDPNLPEWQIADRLDRNAQQAKTPSKKHGFINDN